MDRAKALEKIKKCLALAGSSNPNEAAVALRQAQRLMEMYGISDHELEASDITESFWALPFGPGHGDLDTLETLFMGLIQRAFGVRVMVYTDTKNYSKPRRVCVYYGGRGRPELAEYASKLVWTTMANSWLDRLRREEEAMRKLREKIAPNPKNLMVTVGGIQMVVRELTYGAVPRAQKGKKGDRGAFFTGWLLGVWRNVEEIGFTDDEDATLKKYASRKCKPTEQEADDEGKGLKDLIEKNPALASIGRDEGEKFKLHRPVGVSRKQIGND